MPKSNRAATDRARALFDEHYAYRARYAGDAETRKDAASAKRVATGLSKASNEFSRLLTADQQQVLGQAASIMRALATDLDKASAIARAVMVEQAETDLRARHAAADRIAHARWAGDDAAMLAEARDLADFIDRSHATESDQWIFKHRQCAFAHFPDDMPPGRRLIDALANGHEGERMVLLRRRTAEYVGGLTAWQQRMTRRYTDTWYVGLDDFEAWRSWRKAILGAITPALNR